MPACLMDAFIDALHRPRITVARVETLPHAPFPIRKHPEAQFWDCVGQTTKGSAPAAAPQAIRARPTCEGDRRGGRGGRDRASYFRLLATGDPVPIQMADL